MPSGNSKSTLPDLTLRGRYEAEWGHLQASGVLRRLGWQDGGIDQHATGYGVNAAGSVKTFGEDYLVAGGIWGKGIARYIADISGWGSTPPSTRRATSSPSRNTAAMRPTRTSGRPSCARPASPDTSR